MTAAAPVAACAPPWDARRRFVAVATTAATVDLVSKLAASAFLADRIVDLPGPLDLQLARNPGVAFGLGDAVPAWLLLALTATVTMRLGAAGWRGAFTSTTGVGLVFGGAVANVADRVQGGTVVDMLHLGWWPTFNLADVWITTGAALLVLGEGHLGTRRALGPRGDDPPRRRRAGRQGAGFIRRTARR